MKFHVYVQPGARRNEVVGRHGDSIKIKIKAPPEDGKANAELCAFLAEIFGVAKSSIRVSAGQASRRKTIECDGITDPIARLEKLF